MSNPYYQVSRTAAHALEEFSDDFKSALVLADVVNWAEQCGFVRTSDALSTTFPLPLDAAGFHELKGDIKFRTLYSRRMRMQTKEWQDGVEAPIIEIEAPDFADWAGAPQNIAREWLRQPNKVVAAMLALGSFAGPLLSLYDDDDTDTKGTRRMFAADHPYHPLDASVGTFDNRLSTTVAELESGAFWDEAEDHFRSICGPNGERLGLTVLGGKCLVPSTRSTLFKRILEADTLITTIDDAGARNQTSGVVAAALESNRYKGSISYVVGDELASQDYFYVFAAGRPGLYPYVVQKQGQPEETVFDADSERAKYTRRVGVSYIGRLNAAGAMPQPIARVEITG
jgi:hypothetical protein